jgi:mannose/fructose-specific phosphotransferase system component IIA
MSLFINRPDTTLIAGANLALMIGLAGRECISREELDKLITQSREMLCIVDLEKETISKEEDFF